MRIENYLKNVYQVRNCTEITKLGLLTFCMKEEVREGNWNPPYIPCLRGGKVGRGCAVLQS